MSPMSNADLAPRCERATVVKHFIHRDWQCILITQNYHSKRVADQDSVNASTIKRHGSGIIIACKHCDWLTDLFFFAKGLYGHFFRNCG